MKLIIAPFDIEVAISNGNNCYYDEAVIKKKKGGGYRCKECKSWVFPPSKKKYHLPTYLLTCDNCEKKNE
jgi:hypothetical protein